MFVIKEHVPARGKLAVPFNHFTLPASAMAISVICAVDALLSVQRADDGWSLCPSLREPEAAMVILDVTFLLEVGKLREKTGVRDLSASGITPLTFKVGGETLPTTAHCEYGRGGLGVVCISGGIGVVVRILDALFPDVILLAQVGVNAKNQLHSWERLGDSYHWLFRPTEFGPSQTEQSIHEQAGISVTELKKRIGF